MRNPFMPRNASKDEIQVIVAKLEKYGYLKTAEYKTLRDYRATLEKHIEDEDFIEFIKEDSSNPELIDTMFEEAKAEYETVKYLPMYDTHISLVTLHDNVSHMFWNQDKYAKYPDNWMMKAFVDRINAYFEVETPYKTSYRIGYGWNFAFKKNNFRPYLYGCIRNYLQKNEVEFDIVDVKKICGLVEVCAVDE